MLPDSYFDPSLIRRRDTSRLGRAAHALACAGALWPLGHALAHDYFVGRQGEAILQSISGIAALVPVLAVVLGIVAAGKRLRRPDRAPYASAAVFIGIIDLVSIGMFWPMCDTRDRGSHRISCLSNIKQLGLGALMYSQDFDDRMPLGRNWNDAIYPYLKNDSLFHCPEAEQPA